MRTLWIDATRGFSAQALIAALVELGAAPSPILHALGGLGLPVELRIEPGRVQLVPSLAGILVEPRDVLAIVERASMSGPARALASDAMGRLLLAEAMALPAPTLQVEVDAGALVALCGAAVALETLGVERVLVSRIGVEDEPPPATLELLGEWADALDFGAGGTGSEGAAFLRSFCELGDVAQGEPAWRGHVARGTAVLPHDLRVALGIFSGTSSNL